MSKDTWATYQGLFDKYMNRKIKNLMMQRKNVACIWGEDKADEKLKEYKGYSKS
jgi:hypothetical protein